MRDIFKAEGINQTPEQVCPDGATARCIGSLHHTVDLQRMVCDWAMLAGRDDRTFNFAGGRGVKAGD